MVSTFLVKKSYISIVKKENYGSECRKKSNSKIKGGNS